MSLLALIALGVGMTFGGYWTGRRAEADLWMRHWPEFPFDADGNEKAAAPPAPEEKK